MAEGRPFHSGDGPDVLVLSYDAWRNKFGAPAGMIGRKLYLRGHAFEVVGITSPAFSGIEAAPVSFWVPVSAASAIVEGPPDLQVIGRLRPGVGPKAAYEMLRGWAQGISPAARWIYLDSAATMVHVGREEIAGFLPSSWPSDWCSPSRARTCRI
jgi:MacB-like periplasmic core domain